MGCSRVPLSSLYRVFVRSPSYISLCHVDHLHGRRRRSACLEAPTGGLASVLTDLVSCACQLDISCLLFKFGRAVGSCSSVVASPSYASRLFRAFFNRVPKAQQRRTVAGSAGADRAAPDRAPRCGLMLRRTPMPTLWSEQPHVFVAEPDFREGSGRVVSSSVANSSSRPETPGGAQGVRTPRCAASRIATSILGTSFRIFCSTSGSGNMGQGTRSTEYERYVCPLERGTSEYVPSNSRNP